MKLFGNALSCEIECCEDLKTIFKFYVSETMKQKNNDWQDWMLLEKEFKQLEIKKQKNNIQQE